MCLVNVLLNPFSHAAIYLRYGFPYIAEHGLRLEQDISIKSMQDFNDVTDGWAHVPCANTSLRIMHVEQGRIIFVIWIRRQDMLSILFWYLSSVHNLPWGRILHAVSKLHNNHLQCLHSIAICFYHNRKVVNKMSFKNGNLTLINMLLITFECSCFNGGDIICLALCIMCKYSLLHNLHQLGPLE